MVKYYSVIFRYLDFYCYICHRKLKQQLKIKDYEINQ